MNPFAYPLDTGYILQKKRSLKRKLLEQPGLIEKKIALLSGSTIGEIKNILELFLLSHGIKPTFYEGGYGLFYENLVFDDGSLTAFAPDVVYIHTSCRNIKLWPELSDDATMVQQKLSAEYNRFEQAFRAALGLNCPVVVNNFDLPVYRLMGNREGSDFHGRVHFVRSLNQQLASLVENSPNLYLNDLAYLQAVHGMERFSSQTAWYAYKYAVSLDCIPYLCQSIANIVKSIFGKNKKALALDLDNTLWGGIVGDDGAEGLVLGNETPAGMAYTEFQTYLKALSQLGVLLNVCSKNEEAAALSGLARTDSVLRRDDFICFKANWEPKSQNIAAMAQELNILADSFVFVDDNPAEREIVRQYLPNVAVPELTCPEDYIAALDRNGYFEVTNLSADDARRNAMYKENIQRTQLEASFASYDDYLKSLDMHCQIDKFDAPHAERITQLINKTNQFNLTTRRYTAAEVSALMEDDSYLTLYGRLEDKFGDNGLVTALIAHRTDAQTLDIDLWIMSCRTFKRQLEYAMFDELVRRAKAMGIKTIVGHYYPTAKNLLVRDFYGTIGFEKTAEDDQGNLTFTFTGLDDYTPMCNVMDIEIVS